MKWKTCFTAGCHPGNLFSNNQWLKFSSKTFSKQLMDNRWSEMETSMFVSLIIIPWLFYVLSIVEIFSHVFRGAYLFWGAYVEFSTPIFKHFHVSNCSVHPIHCYQGIIAKIFSSYLSDATCNFGPKWNKGQCSSQPVTAGTGISGLKDEFLFSKGISGLNDYRI